MSPFKKVEYSSDETVESVLRNTKVAAIPARGLRLETCEHYGIRTAYNVKTGGAEAHYFPVYKGKDLIAFSKRKLGVTKKKAWSVVGELSVSDPMFGQHVCKPSKKLWIVEGVYDAPSAWQALLDNQKGGAKHIPNVVSITMGTKNALANITHNKSFIGNYGEVILAFDNDKATDEQLAKKEILGQDAAREVCLTYPEYKTVEFPYEHNGQSVKDSNDLLKIDSFQLFKCLMWEASDYKHDSIINGVQLSTDSLMTGVSRGYMVPDLPETMRLLHGIRDREMTIILAPPKCGKTTLCKLINYRLLQQGIPTLGIYLEEDHQKTVQSFVALDNNVHLPSLRENPGLITADQYQKTIDTVLKPDVAYFYDGTSRKLTPDGVIDAMLWAASVGVKRVILDHLSYVFSGSSGSGNERKDIDLLLTEMADVVRTTGIHPIVVSHIGRKPKNPPTVKGEIQYPWWYEVDESDARGSGAFEQIAWNMVAIEKQITEDKSRGLSRTKVLLNREWDWTGIGDTLTVNPNTGWMETAEEYYD